MRRMPIYLGFVFLLGACLAGCGSSPEGAGNLLTVTGVTPVNSANAGFIFYGVEETDDLGCDGVAGPPFDADQTEQNGFWDGPECAESKTEMTDDLVDISLRNERRPGVKADPAGGRPLLVTGVRITYRYPDGTTPAYAPQRNLGWSLEVGDDSEAVLEGLPLVTLEMKTGDGVNPGIRDLFFRRAAGSEVFLNAIIDIFVIDTLNNESFSIQHVVSTSFINPNV